MWKGQQWWGMSLSSVQHSWDQVQSCVGESDRVSRRLSGCICTTCWSWSTNHRRPLRGWSVPHTRTSWSKTTCLDLCSWNSRDCPCEGGTAAPTFVGNDYFCGSGNPGPTWTYILYASYPLWDGQGCGSPPCCDLTSPPGVTAPWFCKQLPQATTDDLVVDISFTNTS